MCAALQGSRVTALACANMPVTRAMPLSTDCRVPPVSWMLKVRKVSPSRRLLWASQALIWFASQPRPTTTTAPKLAWVA